MGEDVTISVWTGAEVLQELFPDALTSACCSSLCCSARRRWRLPTCGRWRPPWPGAMEDRAYIDGFHPREFSEFYGTPYRWSKPLVYISLHGLGSRGRFRLELETYGGPEELAWAQGRGARERCTRRVVPDQADWHTATIEFGTGWRGCPGRIAGTGRSCARRSACARHPAALVPRAPDGEALPALSQVAAGMLLAASVYLLAVLLGLKPSCLRTVAALAGLAFAFGLLEARLALRLPGLMVWSSPRARGRAP